MMRFLLPLLLCSFAQVLSAQDSKVIPIGKVKKVRLAAKAIHLETEAAQVILTPYAEDIIRVQVIHGGQTNQLSYSVIRESGGQFTQWKEESTRITASTPALDLVVRRDPYSLIVSDKRGKILVEDYSLGTTWQGTEVMCYKKLRPEEKFIGLGEKTGHLDRRGAAYENWNTDDFAYETEADPLYKSTPFFIGIRDSATYGIFLDNTYRTYFSFAASTDDSCYHFGAADGALDYYIFGGSTVADIIRDYTWLTGRMQMPPLWSLGYQQCRWSYYPDSEVLALAKTFRQKKIPADVIYLDIHYMDAYKIFTFHPQQFSQPRKLMDELKGMGFKVVTIVDPGIKIEKGYPAFEQLAAGGFYAKYPDGRPYIGSVWPGRCYFPDFTDPRGRDWWGKSFKTLTDAGVKGFWNDMNEPAAWGQAIPGSVQFNFEGKGASYKKMHNVYGMQMTRATYEGTKALLGERPFLLTRATFSGGQRYSAVWTGDNVASDEHMMLGVRLINSLGISGFPFAGPDVAGFDGEPDNALYLRWLSIGAFTPFFRGHAKADSRDHEPWSFGEQNEAYARDIIRQRYALLPYLYSAFYDAAQNGLPVARSLAIAYPFDPKVFHYIYEHQYMLGDNILVAPVSSKANAAKVYFPPGEWYHLYTGDQYRGGEERLIEAPLHQLPIFFKGGTVTPMVRPGEYAEEQRDTLQLHLYKGQAGSEYSFYEDDGRSYGYEQNKFALRKCVFDGKQNLKIEAQQGDFTSRYRYVELIFHGFGELRNASLDGQSIRRQANSPGLVVRWDKSAFAVSWSE